MNLARRAKRVAAIVAIYHSFEVLGMTRRLGVTSTYNILATGPAAQFGITRDEVKEALESIGVYAPMGKTRAAQ
ncbi:MAG: hypothetical protein NVS2B17_31130 [Candidatus Velthaea sp.]